MFYCFKRSFKKCYAFIVTIRHRTLLSIYYKCIIFLIGLNIAFCKMKKVLLLRCQFIIQYL